MIATYSISRLAASAGVHVETIRYYQRRGLLAEPKRAFGSMRRYSEADAEQVRFIKRAQGIGFTLDEITSLLDLRSGASCEDMRSIADSKLRMIEERIAELNVLRDELVHWIADCDANETDSECPVIGHLERGERR